MNNLINEIKNLIVSFQERMGEHLPALENEVNQIITSQSKDVRAIENLLDSLLSLTMMGLGEKLFIQLVEYYKTVDAEGAAFYWKEFDNPDE